MPKNQDQEHNVEDQLLAVTRDFLDSLGKKKALAILTLDSDLSKHLGIDSLGRVELFHQIEESFQVYLPEHLLVQAQSLADIAYELNHSDLTKSLTLQAVEHTQGHAVYDPAQASSLVDVLINRGIKEPSRIHIYFQDEQGQEHPITYGQLLSEATKVAAGLKERGMMPGDTVAIMLPTCPDFFYTFMGALLAGVIAVPIYPPLRPDKIEEYALRESVILKNAQVRMMVTFDRAEKLASLLKVFIPTLMHVLTVDELKWDTKKVPSTGVKHETAAFIQYTSGSTSDPKGVLLNHANLLANVRAIINVIDLKPSDVGVSWLPLYHDMGLIGVWLTSFYNANPVVIMSPLTFLTRPERWLWAIHYHQGTVSAAPNFAYELCIKKINPVNIEGLDLSSWRLTFNGAEAINPRTLAGFYDTFKAYGLKKTVLYPAYGLAESSVALVLPEPGVEPIIDAVDKDELETKQVAKQATSKTAHVQKFVSVGRPIPNHEVKIVDEQGNEVGERMVGRLVFQGPSRMQGYYRNPDATLKAMVGDYLDSGDYAYRVGKDIYITGRRKDIIIKAGRNFYPEEIEQIVSDVPGTRKGCIVAFGSVDRKWSTEKLVIVAETKDDTNKESIIQEITSRVDNALGIPPDEVVLIKPGTIPKTSSGKLQRSRCKLYYERRTLKKSRLPVPLQVAKLGLKALWTKGVKALTLLARVVYSVYVFTLAWSIIILSWLLMFFMPAKVARSYAKKASKASLFILGMPVETSFESPMDLSKPCVFVANHASYIDAIVMLALLPTNVSMVGKKELRSWPFVSTIAKKLKMLSVDRQDFSKNLSDSHKISEYVRKGQSLMIFPEGTFTSKPGLLSFKLGAFKVAVDTQTPVCPVAIKGSRRIFTGTSMLLHPGVVRVTFCSKLKPSSHDFKEVAALSLKAKEAISEHCGESILDT